MCSTKIQFSIFQNRLLIFTLSNVQISVTLLEDSYFPPQCQNRWYHLFFAAWNYVNSPIDYSSSAVNLIKAKVVHLVIGVTVST